MTPEEIDARDRIWLETVYRGDTVPQLTVRSVVLGMLLGAVMSLSNLYVGLKIGWGLGVVITSSILAFAIMTALRRWFPKLTGTDFSILENNAMASCASAAGYMSSAGLVSAIPALDMMIRDDAATGHANPELQALAISNGGLIVWLSAISVLGVMMAVPLKRQLINIEQLKFPEAIAAAETLRSMYSKGEEALEKARTLAYAALAGVFIKFVAEAKQGDASAITSTGVFGSIARGLNRAMAWKTWGAPDVVSIPGITIAGYPLAAYTLGLAPSTLMMAAGAIIGIKVGASLLVGALLNFGALLPWLLSIHVFELVNAHAPGMTRAAIVARHHIPFANAEGLVPAMRSKWSVWPGTAVMISSGLLSFAFRWRLIVRALGSAGSRLVSVMSKPKAGASTADGSVVVPQGDPLAHIEVPASWFITGFLLSGAACVLLQSTMFGIRWWIGILAVILSFVLGMVAARATGETNVTPIGAMGKITQLAFGGLAPTQPAVNLMTANVTAGAASHSSDLLQDLKTGYLLGANPRKQFLAQLFGVLAGALACVPAYRLIAPSAALGVTIPAPAAQTWRSVAELLTHGFGALPVFAKEALAAGLVVGTIITVLEEIAPASKKWLPSPTGLGIAMVIDAKDSIAMFLGAAIAWMLAKRRPDLDERFTVPVSSGFIAGESLMGVLLAALTVAHVLG